MDFQRIKRLAVFSGPQDGQHAGPRRRYLRIGVIVLGVVLLIIVLLPLFINANSFRPKLESEATDAFGRKVEVGNLSFSLFSGSVRADNVTIADDPAFSPTPFVVAKSLKIGVELMPLILSHQLNVTEITLEQPQITLLKAANGSWNFSSIGGGSTKKESGGTKPTNFSIAKLNVNQGQLSVKGPGTSAKPVIYDNVNISVTNFSFTSQFPFQLTARLPRGGDANFSGKAGPINSADASKTPFEATAKVNGLDFAGLGIIDPASGIAGTMNFDGTLNSNGSQAIAIGVATGKQLKLSPRGVPSPITVTVKHNVSLDLDKQTGTIEQGDIAIGSAQAHLTGTFQTQGDTDVVNMKLSAPAMSVDQIEAMLPAVGVILPSGSKLKGGTLSADLAIVGPLDKLVVTGPVRISNSELANFDLGSKLGALAAFTGRAASNPNTTIQNASLVARVAPEGTQANNINLTVPAIGVITGSGTVSPSGALNFNMVANLSGGLAGGLTKVASARSGQNGIPFSIEGTTSDPKFSANVAGVAAGLAKGEIGNIAKGQPAGGVVTKGVGGLLGRKKQ